MPALIYFVAASLDGYIADANGGVDWLYTIEPGNGNTKYEEFYENIDSLIMGRTTFEVVRRFGDWPYTGKPCWVMTSRNISAPFQEFVISSSSPGAVLEEIRQRHLSNTWLVGGGKLAKSFHDSGLITEYYINVMPYILGSGIPLFEPGGSAQPLILKESKSGSSGMVELIYTPVEKG